MSHSHRIIRRSLGALLALVPALGLASPGKVGTRAEAKPGAGVAPVNVHLKDGRKVPLFEESSERVPVAKVGDTAITLREFRDAIGTTHEVHGAAGQTGKRDPAAIMDRLVDMRLVTLEARAMGIAELPQFKTAMEQFRSTMLRDMLKEGWTRNLRPDLGRVQKIYRESVREWKVRSVTLATEEEAKAFAAKATDGDRYLALQAEAVAQKRTDDTGESRLLQEKGMQPAVAAELRKLKPGQVTPPVKLEKGFAVVLLEAIQYPDSPEQWAAAEWAVLQARHTEVLVKQYKGLLKKYAQVDRKLYRKLDYEAEKPGLDALGKDKRPLAQIEGEAPVTVADLTLEITGAFYHGAGQAQKSRKRLNDRKEAAFDNVMGRRLFQKEAMVRKLHETPTFKTRLRDQEASLLFAAGLERAVIPDVKVTEAEEVAWFEAHRADYTLPRFYRLQGLAFGNAKDAQAALAKLRAGTDFKFLAQNADGQLKDGGALKLAGQVISAAELSPGVQSSLTGAKTGDYRLHLEGEEHHVIHVVEEYPPQLQPIEKVRPDVQRRLQAERTAQAVKDWIAQLRKAYPVESYLVRVGE